MSLFGGIETALSGLRAQQYLTQTATQNVSNADNPDYSRQTVDLTANPPYPAPGFGTVGPGQVGTGVSVAEVRRISDPFTVSQLRLATSQQSAGNVVQDTTAQIERVFNELSGSGISTLLGQFWNAWQETANAPTDPGVRSNLIAQAQSLAGSLRHSVSQLGAIQQNLDQQVTSEVDTLNTLASQIAQLNQQIVAVEVSGQHANDLRDQRDALVARLAGLAQVIVTDQPNGAIRVSLGGVGIVDGSATTPLTTTQNASGFHDIVSPDGTPIRPTSGSLAALLQMRDQEIPGRIAALDSWTQRLITAVNAAHAGVDPTTGATLTNVYDLATPGTPVQRPFFVGTDAGSIAVNPAIVQNPNLVAASRTPNGPGDGSNALAIAALQSDPTAGGVPPGGVTIDGEYQAFATAIGSAVATAKSNLNSQNLLVRHLQARQAQLSGVSLDEEAAHLVSYQRAYQAAARALTVFDDMLDKLINQTGRVGR